MDLEQALTDRFALLEAENPGKEFQRKVIQRILDQIYSGESAIRNPLQSGQATIADIVKCIRAKRCLRTVERDFGSSYLEQILGTAIRDTIPLRNLNRAREVFGLEPLPPSELLKHQEAGLKQQQSKPSA